MLAFLVYLREWLGRESLSSQEGQGLAEYALILVLVAVVVISALTLLGANVFETFWNIGSIIWLKALHP
jgi:pilus assembly protein Flp/PilA